MMMWVILWNLIITSQLSLVIYAGITSPDPTEDLSDCRSSMGMKSGDIPDSALSASSAFDFKSVGPFSSRLGTEKNGGAWCPKKPVEQGVYEWLQIDLGELKVITRVETQGRFGNGQGREYTPNYLLEYQREDGARWLRFRNRKGFDIFEGNSDTYTVVMREVRPPIIARRLRFIPYSRYPRTICMRVEIYGCIWKDGIESYSTRQGDRRGAEVDLYDFTYDGNIQDGYLSGGLGQLTDSELGFHNFRLDMQALDKKGYEWIGWKNDTGATPPVEIVFKFDAVRNFSFVRLHCNNMFSKDVRVFSRAEVDFSIGGKYYDGDPVMYEFRRDDTLEYARYVAVPIPQRVGRYVKLVLYFDARWMMISEVTFNSEIALGNFTAEVAPASTLAPSTKAAVSPEYKSKDPSLVELMPNDGVFEDRKPENTEEKDKNAFVNTKSPSGLNDAYIGIIIGALAALILLLGVVAAVVVMRHRRNKYGSGSLKFLRTDHVNFNLNDLTPGVANGKLCNGNMYNAVATGDAQAEKDVAVQKIGSFSADGYREPCDVIQTRKLPDLPKTPDSTDTSAVYALPNLSKYSPLVVSLPPEPVFQSSLISREESPSPPPPPPPPHPRAVCAAADVVDIQGLSGSSMYSVPNPDLLWREEISVMEFPRDNLKFLEKVGEGQYGEVHLCEAVRMADILGDDFLIKRAGSNRSLLVAVKTLREQACERARADFRKEVEIMSRLKDPNIVRVLGVCTREEPLAVVVEYMKYGDLNQFLLQHVPESTIPRANTHNTLSYGGLIYMATQIASGMKYLEALNMVHRDLATRNCLVGHLNIIKISDFGMSRSLYSNDYYRIEGKAMLPIRWMAWESILLGKFSCKSDVWSFAVTLWEVLTFARQQPFQNLSDEEVIENSGHYYRNDGEEVCPSQPPNCPKEIFDLMMECWNRDQTQRPTFREIHMFLQRKNMGYDPRDEKPNNLYIKTTNMNTVA